MKMIRNTDELRKIAEEATPGPWKEDVEVRGDCVVWGPNGRFLLNAQSEPHWLPYPGETRSVAFDVDRRDCTHIATFDPPTVLELLSNLDQAVSERDALEQKVEKIRELLDYVHGIVGAGTIRRDTIVHMILNVLDGESQ